MIKKILTWININAKWLLLGLLSILITSFCIGWARKNKRIKDLKNSVYILQVKNKLSKLESSYNIKIEELIKLKEKEGPIKEELEKIEKKLQEKVPDMTIEELAKRFQKIR